MTQHLEPQTDRLRPDRTPFIPNLGEPCYSAESPPVAEWGKRPTCIDGMHRHWTALDLLTEFRRSESQQKRGSMTKGKWLLLGAMILGLLVVLYLVLLCPSDCH